MRLRDDESSGWHRSSLWIWNCVSTRQWDSINGDESERNRLGKNEQLNFTCWFLIDTSGWHTQSTRFFFFFQSKRRQWSLITWKIFNFTALESPSSAILIYTTALSLALTRLKSIGKWDFRQWENCAKKLWVSFGGLKSNISKYQSSRENKLRAIPSPFFLQHTQYLCLNMMVIIYKQIKLFDTREGIKNQIIRSFLSWILE